MQHLRPASLCSRLLLKRRPPNSKGNELVKHRDLGIMHGHGHSISLSLSPFSFLFLSLPSLPRLCVCTCLCSTYIQRAHIHVVLRMGTERDWNEWKGVKEESTRVLHRAREQRPASTQLLGPHPHHCQCQILGALLIPSVPNNGKQIKILRVQGSSIYVQILPQRYSSWMTSYTKELFLLFKFYRCVFHALFTKEVKNELN